MQQRKSGRPSGTDGSDFSYRMVVDSRYTKVAKGKSRLSALISTQAVIQLIGLLNAVLSIPKEKGPDTLAISSSVIGLISLLIGEFGRRRSRVIWKLNDLERKKFELINSLLLLLGLFVQIFTISTVVSLIGNMSPPKKAS
ncbi:uncharacterized protein LOC105648596 isoform X2 [Jatropha curcas]|uniref:uncharacterized protein LOC105648596 isoform X2 n=1 Tax=Jatropha curcas TaxID=180498 RepID=UPI0009D694CE|nr:uncharacterized protein LOC105648596 isoform X2 [Jatropha curcas]